MNMQLIHEVGKKFSRKVPDLKPGATVRIHQKIKEGEKERIQIFEGLIIAVSPGNGPDKTFTVRKIVQGIGVEKVFPVLSPNIAKIQVKKIASIRRSKLYYMRKRSGKSARLKERHLTDEESNIAEEKAAEPIMQEQEVQEEVRTEAEQEAPVQQEVKEPEAEKAEAATEEAKAPEAEEAKAPEAEEAKAPEAEEAPKEETKEEQKGA